MNKKRIWSIVLSIFMVVSAGFNSLLVWADSGSPSGAPATRSGSSQPLDYNFNVDWANGVSSGVVDYHYDDATDPDHKKLIMTPTNDNLKVGTVGYSLAINNDANTKLPAGSIKITMPNYLFDSWTDKYAVNRVDSGRPRNTVSWQIPKAPATSAVSDFNYVDNGDGTYTVTNFKEVAGGAKLHFEQAFQFRPSYIKVDSDGVQQRNLDFKLEIDTNGDGTPDVTTNRSLTAEIQNKTKPVSLNLKRDYLSKANGVYMNWQNSWGPAPSDAKDYFYVVWYADMKRGRTDTVPFDYEVVQDNSDGELVGATKRNAYYNPPYDKRGWLSAASIDPNTDTSYPDIAASGWQSRLNQPGMFKEYTPGFALHTLQGWTYTDWDSDRMVMLKRYPMTMLEDAKNRGVDLSATGIPVSNKVTVKTKLASGKVMTETDTATATVKVGNYTGANNIWKYDYNSHSYGGSNMSGVLEFVLNGETRELRNRGQYKTFETEVEGSPRTEPTYNNTTGEYTVKPYTAEIEEGPLYSSSKMNRLRPNYSFSSNIPDMTKLQDEDATYKSVAITLTSHDGMKSVIGGWTTDNNEDVTQSRSHPIEIWTRKSGENSYTRYGKITFDSTGKYTFTSDDGNTVVDDAKGKEIPLPANTSGLKYKYTSEYYNYNFKADTVVEVHPTANMKSILQADKDQYGVSFISSSAKVSYSENGQAGVTTNTEGNPLKIQSVAMTAITSSFGEGFVYYPQDIVDDPVRGVQSNRITARYYQISSLNDTGLPDRDYLNNYVYKKGTIYTLLPLGTSVQKSSVRMTAGPAYQDRAISQGSDFNVEMIEDWEGSGQTMMKVDYKLPPSVTDVRSFNNHNYFLYLSYTLDNPYSNIVDRGNSVMLTSALKVDPDGNDYVLPKESDIANKFNRLKEKDKFSSLVNGDYKYWRFIGDPIQFNPVTVTQSGLTKEVANTIDNAYGSKTDAFIGNQYSYRLAYTSSNYTRTDKLVFYDVLDNGGENAPTEWKGTLDRVDVRSMSNRSAYGRQGEYAKPVVYYATTVPSTFDVDDHSIWSTTMPANKKDIKAIAVDVRKTNKGNDFILDQGNSLSFYVYMNAPKDKNLAGKKAVNETVTNARNFAGDSAGPSDRLLKYKAHSEITLHSPELELHKESNPATGTEAAPTEVTNEKDTPITYTLKIKNKNDLLATRDINIEDVIPDGLTVDKDNIRIKSTALGLNNVLLRDATGVGLTTDGQKLKFNVTLPKDSDMSITIPTKLTDKTVKTTVFKNTAKITSADGVPMDVKSETTYHKAIRQYDLNYVVTGDPTYGLPTDNAVPATVTGIEYDHNQTLAAPLSSNTHATSAGVQGEWKFEGWKKSASDTSTISSVNVRKNETVYGNWRFVPYKNVKVTKKWTDHTGATDTAPVNSVKVDLLRDGVVIDTKDVKAADNWTYTFSNLVSFDIATGHIYTYTVQEHGLNAQSKIDYGAYRYTATTTGDVTSGFTITNKKSMPWSPMIPATRSVTVTKQWSGVSQNYKDAHSVVVKLYKNGTATNRTATLSSSNNFKATFAGLLDSDTVTGAKNVYTFKELDADGNSLEEGATLDINNRHFTVHYDGNKIINTFNNVERSVSGDKHWDDADDQDGVRPSEVTFKLFANGVDTGRTANATKANHWHYEFSGLDTYDEDAAVINYTVKEVPVEKYTADQNGYDFTNKHVPYTRTVKVTKNWKNDTAANRPASITVRLKADGNEVETKNVSPDSDGKWTVDFENLPVNKNGKEIKYTVTEDEVQKYNVEYSGNMDDGMVITNTRVNDPAPKVVKKHGPKTGDTMYPLVYGVVLLSSILALMIIIIRRKSRRA